MINLPSTEKQVVDVEISFDGRVLYAAMIGEGVFRHEKK